MNPAHTVNAGSDLRHAVVILDRPLRGRLSLLFVAFVSFPQSFTNTAVQVTSNETWTLPAWKRLMAFSLISLAAFGKRMIS